MRSLMILTKSKLDNILVFMLVFLTSSFVICNDIWGSAITIVLWLIVFATLLKEILAVKKKLLFITIITLICMGVNTFLCDENIRSYVIICFSYFVVMLLVNIIELRSFKDYFCNIMKWLCVVSLVGYFLYLLIPSLHGLLTVSNKAGIPYSNLIFYVDTTHYNRNTGMFWEPGAFQSFICLALLFEVDRDDLRIKNIFILILTLITTYSTTGYIGLMLILTYWYVNKGTNMKVKIAMFIGIISVVLFVYFNPTINSLLFADSLSNGQSTVFGKLLNFFKSNSSASTPILTSSDIRYNSIFEVLRAFLERPLIGYGYQGLIDRTYLFTRGMNTCTFINWFATYGFLYGLISFVGIIRLAIKTNKFVLCRILFVIILFVLTMSENYVQNPFFFMVVLYGYADNINTVMS